MVIHGIHPRYDGYENHMMGDSTPTMRPGETVDDRMRLAETGHQVAG